MKLPKYLTSIDFLSKGSVAIGALVLAIKYFAYYLTGSVALYSDALESIVNVATAIAALAAIRFSAKPADANHPYGHHKAEYFSVVLEGVLIIIAAVSIFHEAYTVFRAPRVLGDLTAGLAISIGASAINGVWCALLISAGRQQRSPALTADGWHLFTDIISSVGVVVGLVLAKLTGIALLDPALAAIVALNILWSGWKLVRSSLSGLMDEAVEPELLERIRKVIAVNADGAIEAHDVRTRRAGRMIFVDFHLVVPGTMTVSEAHAICDRIERALKPEVQDSLITIHVEPEDKAKHHGVLVL
jgi:cation diffusion facilitator family transporter